ncbi:Lsr2 family protein (plasmid) [Nocardia sp. NBC_01377]|uniref:histone-like nucleoid-structuring protein Lsr2 n=1 Tax=Nocardia sp. NBC_01377 TaxID=2903595 RepID=UPI002F916FB1
MARNFRTVVDVVDDLSGEIDDAAETIEFGYRGTLYEVDLGPANAARLDEALAPFINVARKVRKPAKKPAAKASSAQSEERRKIRAWARDNGHEVAPVGRIDGAVVAAYHEAQRSSADPRIAVQQAS